MKPGATIRPVASMTRAARRAVIGVREISATRSPVSPTSAAYRGAPLPSITVSPGDEHVEFRPLRNETRGGHQRGNDAKREVTTHYCPAKNDSLTLGDGRV